MQRAAQPMSSQRQLRTPADNRAALAMRLPSVPASAAASAASPGRDCVTRPRVRSLRLIQAGRPAAERGACGHHAGVAAAAAAEPSAAATTTDEEQLMVRQCLRRGWEGQEASQLAGRPPRGERGSVIFIAKPLAAAAVDTAVPLAQAGVASGRRPSARSRCRSASDPTRSHAARRGAAGVRAAAAQGLQPCPWWQAVSPWR
eukprot:16412-Chlamydomonas_euryale.AAC.6